MSDKWELTDDGMLVGSGELTLQAVPLADEGIVIDMQDGRSFSGTIGEVCTLATRLAAVERERDALREGLGRIRTALHPAIDAREGAEAALDILTALLGKENTDGQ